MTPPPNTTLMRRILRLTMPQALTMRIRSLSQRKRKSRSEKDTRVNFEQQNVCSFLHDPDITILGTVELSKIFTPVNFT
jgi:hypothetical protein